MFYSNVHYAMELTEVSLQSWLAVIFVVLLNYFRILAYDNGLHDCKGDAYDDHYDDHHDDDHRRLAGGDDGAEFHLTKDCADWGSEYFLFCGGMLIAFGFAVCFANYWSERKIAIVGNFYTIEDQSLKLKSMGDASLQRNGSGRELVEKSEDVWHVCSLRKVLEEKKIEEYHHHISQERKVKEFLRMLTHCFMNRKTTKIQTVEELKSLKLANKAKIKATDGAQSSLKDKTYRAGAVTGEDRNIHPLLFEFDDPLFFKNRKAHKFLTECFQMLMALFIAMYLTNYLFVAQHSRSFGVFVVATVAEIIVMLIQMGYLQDATCNLLAITSLLNEAAELVCEEDHIKSKTLPEIRKEIEALTPEGQTLHDHLLSVYKFVNLDGDGGIGLKEFSSLLFTVDLILPDNEVEILFRAVDSNGSGIIEFDELYELFHSNSTLVSRAEEDGDANKMKELSHQTSKMDAHITQKKAKPNSIVPINDGGNEYFDIEKAQPSNEEKE